MPNVQFRLVPVDYTKPYDEQFNCKRHVIGAYANLARHNMTVTINLVMQAIGMELFNENNIEDAFNKSHRKKIAKLDNIQQVNLQKRLYRHFTFLKRMKLEDEEKKSVQLQTILEVLSDFTSCMAKIRNYYTHYYPFNSPKDIEETLKMKERMGKRLTYLFENTCQMLKKREKLSHEANEVFATQREEVRYTYYWFVDQKLPRGFTFDQLKAELLHSPNHKKTFGQIEYALRGDDSITGLCRINGMKCRYTWNFNNVRADTKTYDKFVKEIKEEIKKKREKYEEDLKKGKSVWPVSVDSVKIGNIKYKLIGEKGIIAEWTQFDRDPDYYAAMSNPVNGLSDVGLIYFLCLFLDKSVAFELMEEVGFTAQCTFTQDNAGENVDILQELMCMNRIRMTKTKLDSEMNDTALALDMINELRKCPKPHYEVLSKEARDEFKDDATVIWEREHGHEAIVNEETQETDDDQRLSETIDKNTPRSTFVRWEDRFPLMALKYIDMTSMFEDIRFQLNLGKYRFAFYMHNKKHSVDGQERLRVLQKEIHGFGRPVEVDEQKALKWGSIFDQKTIQDGLTIKEPDKEGQTPYITEQRSQYAIDEKAHSIGLRWEGWNATGMSQKHYGDLDSKKMFVPYLPSVPIKEDKQTNQAESLLAPQCTLSLYELSGVLFYQYLMTKYNNSKFDAEKIIKETFGNLQQFLKDVANGTITPVAGEPVKDIEAEKPLWEQRKAKLNKKLEQYHLTVTDIPTKLRDYLCNRAIDYTGKLYDSAINRLKAKKEKIEKTKTDFELKKKKIGSKDNKFDKLRATIKTGQLAQWLIRDISDWLPNNSESLQKLTGQKYTVIQSALTMLGQNAIDPEIPTIGITDLDRIFSEALIIAKDNGIYKADCHHPFLKEVIQSCEIGSSIEDLYEKYLEKELEHIDKVTDIIVNGDSFDDYYLVPFLHCDRQRWEEQDADSMRALAKRYTTRPLQLPNGMFTEPVYKILKEIDNPDLKKALEKAHNGEKEQQLSQNLAYLMNLYFETVERDHSQPFYSTDPIEDSASPYCHVYRIFKKLYGEKIDHTNRTTSPAYSIEELRELRKKAIEVIKVYVENEIQTWKNKQQFKFEDKQKKRLKKENDRRYKNNEKQLNIKEEVKKAVQHEINSLRLEMTSKLEKQLKKVYDNERTIRRFKTQDMLLLIMAREILKAKSQDNDFTKGFQLKYVMTDSLLDKPIDYSWDVLIRDKKNGITRKTIEQKGMKMKNYGQFYKFASDHQRLESLLSRLPQSVFQRAEIENEFSYYDMNRGEVFRQVYIIESKALELKPALKEDKNAKEEWFNYIDKKTGKPRAIRNSFIQLLEILAAGKDGILDDAEKTAMQKTRNAFGHNTYDVDLPAVFEGKEEKMKIPEVANGIKDKIEEQTDELKKRIN